MNGNDRYKTNSDLAHFSTDDSKLEEFLADENLSHVCSTDEGKSDSIIFNESSTEESEL